MGGARGGGPRQLTKSPEAGPVREALLELMSARTQVRRFGTNVNQAVAALHATGAPPAVQVAAVEVTTRASARLDEAAEVLARRAPRR